MEISSSSLKLNLGCGSNLKEGYFNVDQHVSLPGIIQMDVFNLPIENDVVDEIFTEHMLEHLSKYEVPIALKEWARVLRSDGKLVMNLPNLEWCLEQWLAKPEEERWGWQLDTIFGLQTHPGEFHKTGFTEARLYELLIDAGFREITITNYWSHGQSCFWIETSKGMKLGEQELLPKISPKLVQVSEKLQIQEKVSDVGYKASIIVPWWDHCEFLELWEHNVVRLLDAEIIFIDNGSASIAKAALQEFCSRHNVKLIRNEKNRGFAAANNQGLEIATGEYVLHLNNDVEILEPPVDYLCAYAGDGISGTSFAQEETGEVYIEGWSLCIKRSTLQALGGWCEDYGPGYWDDVDLCYRARLAGYSLTFVPDMDKFIRHQGNATGRDGRINQIALHIRNRGIFIRKHYATYPKFIIDGVFFQLYQTGIARVWMSLLETWSANSFAQYLVVLDRGGTAPKIPGIRYRLIPPYNYTTADADREMLQQVCDEEGANLFISTYYTTPLSTMSVFLAYDMIPEVMGWSLNLPMWREKHYAIQHASAYMAISENTKLDLMRFFPHISSQSVTVALCGVSSSFSPASMEDVNSFRIKYGILKPYFILVGAGTGYKNTILFFQAFSQLCSRSGFDIVCTGSGPLLEAEFRAYTSGSIVHMLQLSDEELRAAYSGAIALTYPSSYEGFGLPVLEALACGCPVITCPNASIPEVAGESALYVNNGDVNGLINALCDVQKPGIRNSLIVTGLEQAKEFSWSKMAETVSYAFIDATLLHLKLGKVNVIIFPDWSQPEDSLNLDLERVIKAIATHSQREQITLLIYISNISDEDASLISSGITMNLLMREDLNIVEGPEISLVNQLEEIQWKSLLPRIQARIVLEKEHTEATTVVKAGRLPSYDVDSFSSQQLIQLET